MISCGEQHFLWLGTKSELCQRKWRKYFDRRKLRQTHQDNNSVQILVDTTSNQFDRPVEVCSYVTAEQDKPLTYSDASVLSNGDLLNQSLAVSLANSKTICRTAAVIGPLTTT